MSSDKEMTADPIFEDLDKLGAFIVPHSPYPMQPVTVDYERECLAVLHKEIPFLLSDGDLAALWEEYSQDEWCAVWMNYVYIGLDRFMGWLKKLGQSGIIAIYEQSPRRIQ